MTDTYYAAEKTKQFSEMVLENMRNLQSELLAPYYEVEGVSEEEASERFDASVTFRDEADLPAITEPAFSAQLSRSFGQDTFIQFLNEMGIESETTDDLFEDAPGGRLPQIPGLTDLIHDLVTKKGFTVDTEALMEKFPGLDLSSEPVMHLSEEAPSLWAEEDSVVSRRLRKARTYASLYLEGE